MLVAKSAPKLPVMEASGGCERLCAATLAQGGLPVAAAIARQTLDENLGRCRQLVGMPVMDKNRLAQVQTPGCAAISRT